LLAEQPFFVDFPAIQRANRMNLPSGVIPSRAMVGTTASKSMKTPRKQLRLSAGLRRRAG
jgi:hypothetical protein